MVTIHSHYHGSLIPQTGLEFKLHLQLWNPQWTTVLNCGCPYFMWEYCSPCDGRATKEDKFFSTEQLILWRLCDLTRCDAVYFDRQVPTFHTNFWPPSFTLKTEAANSFKIVVPLYQTTWYHISEDCNIDIHHPGNLKFNTFSTEHFLSIKKKTAAYLQLTSLMPRCIHNNCIHHLFSSLCLPACNNLDPTGWIFITFYNVELCLNLTMKFNFGWNWTKKKTRHFTWRLKCNCWQHLTQSLNSTVRAH
jgi:hypothetical protein